MNILPPSRGFNEQRCERKHAPFIRTHVILNVYYLCTFCIFAVYLPCIYVITPVLNYGIPSGKHN